MFRRRERTARPAHLSNTTSSEPVATAGAAAGGDPAAQSRHRFGDDRLTGGPPFRCEVSMDIINPHDLIQFADQLSH
jgi:hypothetical protein